MYIKEGVQMVVRENKRIKVKRINETRSNDISVMIDEGGLGVTNIIKLLKRIRTHPKPIYISLNMKLARKQMNS